MRIRTLATIGVLLACTASSIFAQQVQVAISADGSIADVGAETLVKVAPTRTPVDIDSFILSFPQFEGAGDVSDTVCASIIPKAQKAYTDQVFDEAAAHMTRCIDMTKKNPNDRAPWAYYFRASSRYQAQQVDQAAEDIVEAIRLSPLAPQHWALKAAISVAKKDLEGAVSDVLHQLALLLDLGDDTTTLYKVCREVPKSFDFRCSFRALEEYIERKLEWSIKEDEQKMRMKLWEESKLKKAFPEETIASILGCLRELTRLRFFLPLSSPARLGLAAVLPRLSAMFQPTSAQKHAEAAVALFGEGDLANGLSHSMHEMALLLFQSLDPAAADPEINPMHESWTELLRYSSLLLSAGMEAHITNMARNILSSPIVGQAVLQNIVKNCNVPVCGVKPAGMTEHTAQSLPYYNTPCRDTIPSGLLTHVFTSCLRHQRVFPILFSEQADSHRANLARTNEFGFNSWHHLALLGEVETMREAIRLNPDVNKNAMTHMGLSALHLAAMRGNAEMTKVLLQEQVRTDWLDWKNRTALDVACVHGFPWSLEVAKILRPKDSFITHFCSQIRSIKSPLDASSPSQIAPVPGTNKCLQSGGWSGQLVYDADVMPDPFPCLNGISASPKLSFVTPDELKQHVLAQKTLRQAQGQTVLETDPIELKQLPTDESPYARLYSTTCDLPIVRAPNSYQEFIADIVSMQRPVLIRGGLSWAKMEFSETYHALQREQLLANYGQVKLQTGKIPYASTFGLDSSETTLREFIGVMHKLAASDHALLKSTPSASWRNTSHFASRPYVFLSVPLPAEMDPKHVEAMQKDPKSTIGLLDLFVTPTWLHPPKEEEAASSTPEGQLDPTTHTPLTLRKVQFFIGPRFSGAPQHFHRSALNLQWFGRKHWTIRPPQCAKYSKVPQLESWTKMWQRNYTARASGAMQPQWSNSAGRDHCFAPDAELHCIQEAGDLVFVPDFWSHGTINLEESIGFAAELLWGATHFSI